MTKKQAQKIETIRTITTGKVCGTPNIKKAMAVAEDDTPIMRVYGKVVNFAQKVNTSTDKVDTKFMGSFRAVNLLSGKQETFEALNCYLPGVAEDMIMMVLGGDKASDMAELNIAFDIIASPDEKSATGYVYKVNDLIKPAENDPFEAITSKLPEITA